MNIMLDLETLSTRPNAAIVSIGAVKFDNAGIQGDPFHICVSAASNEPFGRDIQASTVVWWMGQSEEARNVLLTSAKDLPEVLFLFAAWVGTDCTGMWGNGAAFDNVVLASAYEALDRPGKHLVTKRPWSFRVDRCYRTLLSFASEARRAQLWVKHSVGIVSHNALDDAKRQALIAIDVCNDLGIKLA